MDSDLEVDWESFASAFGREGMQTIMSGITDAWRVKEVLVEVKQRQAAARMRDTHFTEALGECHMVVAPSAYHYWGQRLGYECWQDDQFVREFKRDNPEARVKQTARNPTILNQWGAPAREVAA